MATEPAEEVVSLAAGNSHSLALISEWPVVGKRGMCSSQQRPVKSGPVATAAFPPPATAPACRPRCLPPPPPPTCRDTHGQCCAELGPRGGRAARPRRRGGAAAAAGRVQPHRARGVERALRRRVQPVGGGGGPADLQLGLGRLRATGHRGLQGCLHPLPPALLGRPPRGQRRLRGHTHPCGHPGWRAVCLWAQPKRAAGHRQHPRRPGAAAGHCAAGGWARARSRVLPCVGAVPALGTGRQFCRLGWGGQWGYPAACHIEADIP